MTQPLRSEVAVDRPVVGRSHGLVDLARAERAATDLLTALGLDTTTSALADTPRRMVGAYTELLTAPEFEMTYFPNESGYDELVLVEDIPVRSLCEHHLLPFVGVAHVGYLPGERVLGLSKFARSVDLLARQAQTQERLTVEIAEHFVLHLEPAGVGVVLVAEHSCMSLRGARAMGARTVTTALRGALAHDRQQREEFLTRTRPPRANAFAIA